MLVSLSCRYKTSQVVWRPARGSDIIRTPIDASLSAWGAKEQQAERTSTRLMWQSPSVRDNLWDPCCKTESRRRHRSARIHASLLILQTSGKRRQDRKLAVWAKIDFILYLEEELLILYWYDLQRWSHHSTSVSVNTWQYKDSEVLQYVRTGTGRQASSPVCGHPMPQGCDEFIAW